MRPEGLTPGHGAKALASSHRSLPTCWLADLLTCRPVGLPTCRLADLLTCPPADQLNCRPADMLSCRPVDQPTCRLADLPTVASTQDADSNYEVGRAGGT